MFVCERESEIVGFVSGGISRDEDAPSRHEIYAIYVLDCHCRLGIGRKLIHRLFETFHVEDYSVWVLIQNTGAIEFYRSLGMRPDGVSRHVRIGSEQLEEIRLVKSRQEAQSETTVRL